MTLWSDVLPALTTLKKEQGLAAFRAGQRYYEASARPSPVFWLGMVFSMLFSSEPLGVYKPAPEAYEEALGLVRVRPDEAVMVAAHAYDLRAARKSGMRAASCLPLDR
ncbi:hypothetical protein AAE478_000145 [Parahypoxylon ruwenzoriense]